MTYPPTTLPQSDISPDSATPAMTRFVKVEREASTAMVQRSAFMALPLEFFAQFFDGRVPTVEEKIFWIERSILEMTELNVYANNLYEVTMRNEGPMIRLSIRRHDGQQCKEWKHFQEIKNTLIGPDHEAVELFPSENRLIDTNNEYHLWVHPSRGYRFPFGFARKRVVFERALTYSDVDAMRTPPVARDSGAVPGAVASAGSGASFPV